MSTSTLGVRYAKALFLFSSDNNSLDEVYADMQTILHSYQSSKAFKEFIFNPVLKASDKQEILKNSFGSKIHADTNKFLSLLFTNRRETALQDIIYSFADQYRKAKNIKKATIITAKAISEQTKNELQSKLEQTYAAKVELNEAIDESIIGGFILRMDDHQLDASIARGLQNIKNEFINTSISTK